ncbi:MAG: hypothetical protein KIT54_11910 [Phycisphaeraceae bacterium]|nr:hypothetical protein [Phycisphaeraceae bacterium]
MNDFLQAPAIEALPAPPTIEHFLFEQPWPTMALLAILAILAWLLFRARKQQRLGVIVAVLLLACAGGIAILASRVTTDREVVLNRTVELIEATAKADTTALRDILDVDTAVLRSEGSIRRVLPPSRDTADILAQVDRYLKGQYSITSVKLPNRQATIDGRNTARSQVRVAVEADALSRTHYSWWRLHWARGTDGQWRCFEIEPLWIQFVGSSSGR